MHKTLLIDWLINVCSKYFAAIFRQPSAPLTLYLPYSSCDRGTR